MLDPNWPIEPLLQMAACRVRGAHDGEAFGREGLEVLLCEHALRDQRGAFSSSMQPDSPRHPK
jgi:hypothetical protein